MRRIFISAITAVSWIVTIVPCVAQGDELALARSMKGLGDDWSRLSVTGERLILHCPNNTYMAVRLASGAAVAVDLQKTNSVMNPYVGIVRIRGKFLRNNSRQNGSCLRTLTEAQRSSDWDDKTEQVVSGGTTFTIPDIPSFDYEIYYQIRGSELWLTDGNEVFRNGFMRAPGSPQVDPNSAWLRAFRYPIK